MLASPAAMIELKRFVAIKIDVTDSKGKGAELKNKKFKAAAIPFMVYYPSADVPNELAWFTPRASSGALSLDEFLAKLKSIR